jgi:hypothetical protein
LETDRTVGLIVAMAAAILAPSASRASSTVSNQSQAVFSARFSVTRIPTLPGFARLESMGIDAAGDVAGIVKNPRTFRLGTGTAAFFFRDGVLTRIPVPAAVRFDTGSIHVAGAKEIVASFTDRASSRTVAYFAILERGSWRWRQLPVSTDAAGPDEQDVVGQVNQDGLIVGTVSDGGVPVASKWVRAGRSKYDFIELPQMPCFSGAEAVDKSGDIAGEVYQCGGFADSVALWPRHASGTAYEYSCNKVTCLWNYPRQLPGLATTGDGIHEVGRPVRGVQRVVIVGSAFYQPGSGQYCEQGATGCLKGRSWLWAAGVRAHGHKIVWISKAQLLRNTFGIEGPTAFVRGTVWMIANSACHGDPCSSQSGRGLLWVHGRRIQLDRVLEGRRRWTISAALGIDERGEIAAVGHPGASDAPAVPVLLTPQWK